MSINVKSVLGQMLGQESRISVDDLISPKGGKFSSDTTVIMNATVDKIVAKGNLLLVECERVNEATAEKNIFMIRCLNHGKITAKERLFTFASVNNDLAAKAILVLQDKPPEEMIYKDGRANNNLHIFCTKVVRLINYTVGGSVVFFDKDKKEFQGKVILEGSSSIGDLAHTNAEIVQVESSEKKTAKPA